MKCVKSETTGEIIRVKEDYAVKLTAKDNWKYVSKKEWKVFVRDVKEKENHKADK